MMHELRLTPTEEEIIIRMCNYDSLKSGENVGDGWMKREQIEQQPAPYTPNKRWDYLDYSLRQGKVKVQTGKKSNGKIQWKDQTHEEKELIEIKVHSYKDKYKRSHSEKVYRIKNDEKTFTQLFLYFKKEGRIYEFMQTTYYKESKALRAWLWLVLADIHFKEGKKTSSELIELWSGTSRPPLVPPTFIEIMLNLSQRFKTFKTDKARNYNAEIMSDEIFKASLIIDIMTCPIPEIQRQMFKLLEDIQDKKKEAVKKG